MAWYIIVLFCVVCLIAWIALSSMFYRQFFKRFYDLIFSFITIIVLSPVLLILVILGSVKMKGNPFFKQPRPGKNEKVFNLIKFRTMSNEKDSDGNLLPDELRLTKYGLFLRSTSLDELPELFNIFLGQLSFVGPRPLMVSYLNYYTEEEKHRHDITPGLTGYAQVHGRNYVTWEDKFEMDNWYVKNYSLPVDMKILLETLLIVVKRSDIETASSIMHDGVLYRPLDVERGERNNN